MDWKVFAPTFIAVFLAELGDKTQLATLALAAGQTSRFSVFAAAALALICTSAIAVVSADVLGNIVPASVLRRLAAALFVVMGVVLWFRAGE